jgi:hypothetical protein
MRGGWKADGYVLRTGRSELGATAGAVEATACPIDCSARSVPSWPCCPSQALPSGEAPARAGGLHLIFLLTSRVLVLMAALWICTLTLS